MWLFILHCKYNIHYNLFRRHKHWQLCPFAAPSLLGNRLLCSLTLETWPINPPLSRLKETVSSFIIVDQFSPHKDRAGKLHHTMELMTLPSNIFCWPFLDVNCFASIKTKFCICWSFFAIYNRLLLTWLPNVCKLLTIKPLPFVSGRRHKNI